MTTKKANNKCRAFTSLEQSKELEKFLPPESADMEYLLSIKGNGSLIGTVPFVKDDSEVEDSASSHTYNRIACWSLAALLNVLPTLDGRNAILCKDIRCDKWHVCYHSTATLSIIDTERYDNPVDACVAMIDNLHELKML